MANTTNFNWETPDDTDLVKDGAAAIRTLGSAIDTSLVDLKGGTTGQVLAKNSNTDMDFVWSADASGIPATIFDAKGDIIAASAADTAARLAVGANDTVLTADSSTATGLKWAAASSGALTLINTTNFSSVTTQSLNNVFSSTYTNYAIIVNITSTATSGGLRVRLRASGTDATGSNYLNRNISINSNNTFIGEYTTQTTGFFGASTSTGSGIMSTFFAPNLAQQTFITGESGADVSNDQTVIVHNLSTAYDGLTIYTSNSVNMAGSISVYGFSK